MSCSTLDQNTSDFLKGIWRPCSHVTTRLINDNQSSTCSKIYFRAEGYAAASTRSDSSRKIRFPFES